MFWQTSLHGAAENGHKAVVRMLLDAGADVHAADSDGWTPLYLTARNGHEAVARVLIEAGANVGAATSDVRIPLNEAARKGHGSVVWVLLNAGADVNAANKNGSTPLHEAAWNGHEAVVRRLSAHGAVPLTQLQREKIMSEQFYYLSPEHQQQQRTRLEQLQVMTERASLKRKHAIESTLDGVKIRDNSSVIQRIPRDLQKIIASMSEHPDMIAWW